MNQDKIEFEILTDGTLKLENDKISAANHKAADELHKGIEQMLGGGVKANKKHPHAHSHSHEKQNH